MTTASRQPGRRWLLIGAIGIWLAAAVLLGGMLLWLMSPPGLGPSDWGLLGLDVLVVVALPVVVRAAIRRAGAAALALAILGAAVCLIAVPAFVLVAAAAATGAWSLVVAALAACGVALVVGSLILVRTGPAASGHDPADGS